MPIRPNQDYWHKINELWDQQEQQENPTQKQVTENREQTEKTPQKPTALSGWRYLYHHNQLVAEVPTIYHTDGNAALQTEIMRCEENWEEAIYWLYQGSDYSPTARYERGELHYTVTDQIGTITELLTEDGYIDYRQKLNLWGEAEIDGHRHYAANDSNPLKCNHRFVGQYYDDESELHYNRFRYYSPETGQYISHDPIGLRGGFNPYGYVGIPTKFVDPLGLIGTDETGYSVYGLYDVDPVTGRTVGDPYYIGITNDISRRTGEHANSGRLTTDQNKMLDGKTRLVPLESDINYGQARGYEQAYIEHYKTKTGARGEKISQENRGNMIASFDHDNKTRDRNRQDTFEENYQSKMDELRRNQRASGCGG